MNFQKISTENFSDETRFSREFSKLFFAAFDNLEVENREELLESIQELTSVIGNEAQRNIISLFKMEDRIEDLTWQ